MNNSMSVSRYCSAIVSVFALLLVILTLVIPNRLTDIHFSSFLFFPLELWLGCALGDGCTPGIGSHF
jgi:hypothetical protein